jgi:hypothetical protein
MHCETAGFAGFLGPESDKSDPMPMDGQEVAVLKLGLEI